MQVWLASLLVACMGCSTVITASPLPCREIAEVHGLEQQILDGHYRDNVLNQLRLPAQTDVLRAYAIESSAKCHGNRKLR